MRKIVSLVAVIIATILFVFASNVNAELSNPQKGRFGAEVSVWFPTIDGNARIDDKILSTVFKSSDIGTDLDIVDTLGMDKTTANLDINLWVNITKRNRFSYAFFQDIREGERILKEQIKVQGVEFDVGSNIKSDLSFQRHRFLYERALLRNDRGRLAFGTGIEYLIWEAGVEGEASANKVPIGMRDVGEKFVAPLPVISGLGEIHLIKGFGVFAEITGFSMTVNDADVVFLDGRAGPNFKTRFVFVQAGYQFVQTKVRVTDEGKLDYFLGGPFASVGAKF